MSVVKNLRANRRVIVSARVFAFHLLLRATRRVRPFPAGWEGSLQSARPTRTGDLHPYLIIQKVRAIAQLEQGS